MLTGTQPHLGRSHIFHLVELRLRPGTCFDQTMSRSNTCNSGLMFYKAQHSPLLPFPACTVVEAGVEAEPLLSWAPEDMHKLSPTINRVREEQMPWVSPETFRLLE